MSCGDANIGCLDTTERMQTCLCLDISERMHTCTCLDVCECMQTCSYVRVTRCNETYMFQGSSYRMSPRRGLYACFPRRGLYACIYASCWPVWLMPVRAPLYVCMRGLYACMQSCKPLASGISRVRAPLSHLGQYVSAHLQTHRRSRRC